MKEYTNGTELDKLAILWTTPDRDVAMHFALMYPRVSKQHDWWDVVRVILWGPSGKLLATDEELQLYIKTMIDNGVEVLACKGSAGIYGVEEKLIDLGIEVIYMGKPLTDMIKSDWKVISA